MVNSKMTTIFIGCSLMVPINIFFLFTPPSYTCIPVPSTFIDNGKPLSVVSVCRCVELCLGLVPSMVPECLTCQTTTRY